MDLWRKSSYSGTDQECVEVAPSASSSLVRDTKSRERGHVEFDRRAWAGLLAVLKR